MEKSVRGGILLFLLSSFCGTAFAVDKTSPEYLRSDHAGIAKLNSDEPVDTLFPKLLHATQECWVGEVTPGAMGLPVSSASRTVLGDSASDKKSGYILVQAKGFFGALKSNFLQIDVNEDAAGSSVTVYYKNRVKGQEQFVGQVEHWLNGDLSFCDSHPFMRKIKEGS